MTQLVVFGLISACLCVLGFNGGVKASIEYEEENCYCKKKEGFNLICKKTNESALIFNFTQSNNI